MFAVPQISSGAGNVKIGWAQFSESSFFLSFLGLVERVFGFGVFLGCWGFGRVVWFCFVLFFGVGFWFSVVWFFCLLGYFGLVFCLGFLCLVGLGFFCCFGLYIYIYISILIIIPKSKPQTTLIFWFWTAAKPQWPRLYKPTPPAKQNLSNQNLSRCFIPSPI